MRIKDYYLSTFDETIDTLQYLKRKFDEASTPEDFAGLHHAFELFTAPSNEVRDISKMLATGDFDIDDFNEQKPVHLLRLLPKTKDE